jgi:hypothetical protein
MRIVTSALRSVCICCYYKTFAHLGLFSVVTLLSTILIKHLSTVASTFSCTRQHNYFFVWSSTIISYVPISFCLHAFPASCFKDWIMQLMTCIWCFDFCTLYWVRQLYLVVWTKCTLRPVTNAKWHRVQLETICTLSWGCLPFVLIISCTCKFLPSVRNSGWRAALS